MIRCRRRGPLFVGGLECIGKRGGGGGEEAERNELRFGEDSEHGVRAWDRGERADSHV
jgi:hypothetical protein